MYSGRMSPCGKPLLSLMLPSVFALSASPQLLHTFSFAMVMSLKTALFTIFLNSQENLQYSVAFYCLHSLVIFHEN